MKILRLDFCQNQLKVEKPIKMAIFGPTSLIIEWSRFFSEKTAVYASYPYHKEHSCQKAKKSLARFSRFRGNQLQTNGQYQA